ncbi:dol-P-Glc:Glc(2)Man(9)GlcNAc(2)-PP-Dol alpha-1,2-glucosyltransferase isoform X3 [Aquarana catesbeiana]|uniref:dol-P-Glc:Glc(2)Man(9)GlcNAc(2)-PP-Dol alpha-1,2-glucosyltransferase isoform X3 n=1 Tax=Aquarana catesbeiana TaxID=8400 RepID=UPI003CC94EBD
MEKLEGYYFSALFSGCFLLSSLLFSKITREQRDPYMDEVFHIPQAQQYCQGHFNQEGGAYLSDAALEDFLEKELPVGSHDHNLAWPVSDFCGYCETCCLAVWLEQECCLLLRNAAIY